jgi:hypothetical protein
MPEVGPSVLLKGDRFIVAKRGAPAEDLPRAQAPSHSPNCHGPTRRVRRSTRSNGRGLKLLSGARPLSDEAWKLGTRPTRSRTQNGGMLPANPEALSLVLLPRQDWSHDVRVRVREACVRVCLVCFGRRKAESPSSPAPRAPAYARSMRRTTGIFVPRRWRLIAGRRSRGCLRGWFGRGGQSTVTLRPERRPSETNWTSERLTPKPGASQGPRVGGALVGGQTTGAVDRVFT